MFGDFDTNFLLPPVPLDDRVSERAAPVRPSTPSDTTALQPTTSPGSLDDLHTALEVLPKIDPDYSAAVSDAFAVIGLLIASDSNPSFA